jgi:hypothetical protein
MILHNKIAISTSKVIRNVNNGLQSKEDGLESRLDKFPFNAQDKTPIHVRKFIYLHCFAIDNYRAWGGSDRSDKVTGPRGSEAQKALGGLEKRYMARTQSYFGCFLGPQCNGPCANRGCEGPKGSLEPSITIAKKKMSQTSLIQTLINSKQKIV